MASARPRPTRQTLDFAPADLAPRVGTWRGAALLESGPGFGPAGRWSLLAAQPRLSFEAFDDAWTLTREGTGTVVASGNSGALAALAALADRFGLADPAEDSDPDRHPFRSGLIGFLGYDLAPRLERLPRKAARDSRLPDLRFSLYDTALTVDHHTGAVTLQADDLVGEGPAAVERRCRAWREKLRRGPSGLPARSVLGPVVSHFTEAGYFAAVRQALEYVAAGDVFQVNLSQRFEAFGAPDPLDLYLRLKAMSPAPFGAFLRWGDLAVVSASPESFYATRGDSIATRPIKGTRPRGASPEADARLARELESSPKDRAELTMIVDLERNDLGRVCQYGTVRVVSPLAVESFAQVHHLVATVEGRLRPGLGPIDVVRATFPGGSITGAPKVRAMEIIDELEPTRRGLYTGAIGYLSRGGTSGFNIAIRTLVAEGDRVSYQVGGGIVSDSDPGAEYEETLHKGRGLRAVIEGRGDAP